MRDCDSTCILSGRGSSQRIDWECQSLIYLLPGQLPWVLHQYHQREEGNIGIISLLSANLSFNCCLRDLVLKHIPFLLTHVVIISFPFCRRVLSISEPRLLLSSSTLSSPVGVHIADDSHLHHLSPTTPGQVCDQHLIFIPLSFGFFLLLGSTRQDTSDTVKKKPNQFLFLFRCVVWFCWPDYLADRRTDHNISPSHPRPTAILLRYFTPQSRYAANQKTSRWKRSSPFVIIFR